MKATFDLIFLHSSTSASQRQHEFKMYTFTQFFFFKKNAIT